MTDVGFATLIAPRQIRFLITTSKRQEKSKMEQDQ